MTVVQIGHGNSVIGERVLAILEVEGSAIRKTMQEKKSDRRFVDATQGRAAASMILFDNDTVIVSSIGATALRKRFEEASDEEAE